MGALLAAIAWTISGFLALALVRPPATNMGSPGSLSWYLIGSADAVAELGMMAAVAGLHAWQKATYGSLGKAGFMLSFVGAAFAATSTVLWLSTGRGDGIVGLLFAAGGLGVLVGFPVLGVATLRAGTLPRWCGLLLVGWLVYFPLFFFLVDFYGGARSLLGPVFAALGYALWTGSSTPGERPSRIL